MPREGAERRCREKVPCWFLLVSVGRLFRSDCNCVLTTIILILLYVCPMIVSHTNTWNYRGSATVKAKRKCFCKKLKFFTFTLDFPPPPGFSTPSWITGRGNFAGHKRIHPLAYFPLTLFSIAMFSSFMQNVSSLMCVIIFDSTNRIDQKIPTS